MVPKKGYILVEGHGEVKAAGNLVVRLSREIGFSSSWRWKVPPHRWNNLHQWEPGIRRGAEFVRPKPDAGALLILRDGDKDCPKEIAPQIAEKLRGLNLPFPVAYVLLHPEYEVLFLPCLEKMGFPPWDGETWESRRGIKEWLSSKLPKGESYKPTVDQLRMTRQIDFDVLRKANVPCFGSLERALIFLRDNLGLSGAVYP